MSKKIKTRRTKHNSRSFKLMVQGVKYDYENGEAYLDTQPVVDALRKLINSIMKNTDSYTKLRPFLVSIDEILSEHTGLKSQKDNIDKYISGIEDALQVIGTTVETDLEATTILEKYEHGDRYIAYYKGARNEDRTIPNALSNSIISATLDLYGVGMKPISASIDDLREMKQQLLASGARLSPGWDAIDT